MSGEHEPVPPEVGEAFAAWERELAAPPRDRVLAVQGSVEEHDGRWVLWLDVVLESGAVRHRIADYPSRAKAEVARTWVVRSASAHHPPPLAPEP